MWYFQKLGVVGQRITLGHFLEKKEAKTSWPVYFSRSSSNTGFDTKSKCMEEKKGGKKSPPQKSNIIISHNIKTTCLRLMGKLCKSGLFLMPFFFSISRPLKYSLLYILAGFFFFVFFLQRIYCFQLWVPLTFELLLRPLLEFSDGPFKNHESYIFRIQVNN